MFASTNPHKCREVREILAPSGISVAQLNVSEMIQAPEEDAGSFAGNARLKAVYYARALGRFVLADDSGFEVDALGGAPGVDSAHWAGVFGSREERDRANNEKLIATMMSFVDGASTARLVCCVCFVSPAGEVLFEGRETLEGLFTKDARGRGGFGYDGHLLLPELGKTAAELEANELYRRSHRGKALRRFQEWFRENPPSIGR